MRVSFVIPARNEQAHLPRCLASIAALERPSGPVGPVSLEIVVVDNRSTDATAAIAAAAGAQVVSVEPGRVAVARTAGARAASGDVLAFIDADCELPPRWLVAVLDHLETADVVACGGSLAPPRPGATWIERRWYALAAGDGEGAREVAWLASFNLAVPRAAFDEVGGFDPSLVTCEDADLGYRLAARGRLVQEPGVAVVHHGESRTLRDFFRREAWRGRGTLRAMRRPGGARWGEAKTAAVPVVFVGALATAGMLLALGRVVPSLGCLALSVALAMGQGWRRGVTVRHWPASAALMSVYLLARFAGMCWPMRRVEREEASGAAEADAAGSHAAAAPPASHVAPPMERAA